MKTLSPLDYLRIAALLISFVYCSVADIRTREVSNKVWLILIPLGAAFTAYDYLSSPQTFPVTLWLISVAFIVGLSLGLFYLGFVGGADSKAFISIAAIMPLYPAGLTPLLGDTSVFFPLSVLTNSVIFSTLSIIALLVWNLVIRIRTNRSLFTGFEEEPLWKKLLTLLTSVPKDLQSLKKDQWKYSVSEQLIPKEDGGYNRKLKVVYRVTEEEEDPEDQLKPYLEQGVEGRIWASPLLPMLVFVTIGLVFALFIGDIVALLVFRLLPLF